MRTSLPGLLAVCITVAGCGEPVRIGVREAHAAGTAPHPAASAQIAPEPDLRRASQRGHPGEVDAVLRLPEVPQPHSPSDIVGFRLEHDGPPQTLDITFGEVFLPGQLQPGTNVAARIDGKEVPAQIDAKTTNPDGSVRFGIVTLRATAPAEGMLVRHPGPAGVPLDLATLADKYDLTLDLVIHHPDDGQRFHISAGTVLAKALLDGTASYWLRGPMATEARVTAPVTGSLRLVFDIRLYADGATLTDVEFNNDLALQPVGGMVDYDVSIRQNGKLRFEQLAIKQFQYQTWHREIWSVGAPEINVVHDVGVIERANAVQNYDVTTGISPSVVAEAKKLMGAPGFFGILGTAGVAQHMGMTGGRWDIGPLTMWNTAWLLTQNPVLKRMALAQSDAAGSVPWHFFDMGTGTYLSLEQHPTLWTDPRGRGHGNTTGLPEEQDVPDGHLSGWFPDAAHQPELNYLPYIMTGSRYRLDQLDAQAAWSLVGMWPIAREYGRGIVANTMTQVRTGAWDLREIVEAAYVDPDDDRLKSYFTRIAANNMVYLLEEARTAQQGEAYGWVKGDYGSNNGAIAPWQQDYLATTLVLAARQGVPGAKQVLSWQTNFLAGRFLASDRGFPPFDGVTYNLFTWDKLGPLQTWREIERVTATHPNLSGGGNGWPMTFVPYIQAAEAVLSGIITVTGSSDAEKALAWLQEHSAEKAPRNRLQTDPTWNIVARPAGN